GGQAGGGAPVPQARAVHTRASATATSGDSAAFRDFRPASLPTATTRDRGRLSLIATMRQEVLQLNGPSHACRFLWLVRMQRERFGPTTPPRPHGGLRASPVPVRLPAP